jgi:hypothetical protein
LTISQQKPGKIIFREKVAALSLQFNNRLTVTARVRRKIQILAQNSQNSEKANVSAAIFPWKMTFPGFH